MKSTACPPLFFERGVVLVLVFDVEDHVVVYNGAFGYDPKAEQKGWTKSTELPKALKHFVLQVRAFSTRRPKGFNPAECAHLSEI